MNKEINKTKIRFDFIFFIILIVVTFYILFNGKDLNKILSIIHTVHFRYIVVGFLCMCLYMVFEAINIKYIMSILNSKITFLNSIKYTLIGFFYSAITPGSSGGQPMEAYHMNKDKLPLSNSLLTLLINISSYQIVMITLSIVGFIYNYSYIASHPLIKYMYLVGVILNGSLLTIYFILIFSKKLYIKIIRFVINILSFFKIKNIDKRKEKLESSINEYRDGVKYLKNNNKMIYRVLFTTLLQILSFYSISFFIYKSFGLSSYNIISFLTLQSILYVSVSALPLPGSVGVSESGYMILYKKIYSDKLVNSAMLLNRGISFYLFVMISGLTVLGVSIYNKYKHTTKD